jgi:hypothetical protein
MKHTKPPKNWNQELPINEKSKRAIRRLNAQKDKTKNQ